MQHDFSSYDYHCGKPLICLLCFVFLSKVVSLARAHIPQAFLFYIVVKLISYQWDQIQPPQALGIKDREPLGHVRFTVQFGFWSTHFTKRNRFAKLLSFCSCVPLCGSKIITFSWHHQYPKHNCHCCLPSEWNPGTRNRAPASSSSSWVCTCWPGMSTPGEACSSDSQLQAPHPGVSR